MRIATAASVALLALSTAAIASVATTPQERAVTNNMSAGNDMAPSNGAMPSMTNDVSPMPNSSMPAPNSTMPPR